MPIASELPASILERVPDRLLLGPGPSNAPPSVLAAAALPLLGHLDPRFCEFLDEVQGLLRRLFVTANPVTFPVSGTGSAGMETLVMNLFEAGDRVAVGVNGVFGERIVAALMKIGAVPLRLECVWGEPVRFEAVDKALDEGVAAVWLVHAETSTGVLQPDMARIGARVRERGALFVVDCVTSLGGAPLLVDDWQIDAAFSGTQKCLNVTSGLAPITLGERALAKVRARKTPVPSWYFDLAAVLRYWDAQDGKRMYHHTAPITPIYALHEGARLVLADGLQARWTRHDVHAAALAAGLEALGFTYRVARREWRLPMLHAVKLPAWCKAEDRSVLLSEYGIEVGAALGAWAGDTWRIGLMGMNANQDVVRRLLAALDAIATRRGGKPGGLVAADRHYLR